MKKHNQNFINYAKRVIAEAHRLLPNLIPNPDVTVTYPFKEEELLLVALTHGYPVQLNRPSIECCYHDEQHMLEVAGLSLYYFYLSGENLLVSNGVVLYLAGLFHDLEHSLGLESDLVNINNTIVSLGKLLSGKCVYRTAIVNAIRSTQFPSVGGPKTPLSKYLVDADLTAAGLKKNAGEELVRRLLFETNRARALKELPLVKPSEFLEQHMQFIDTVKLSTNEARRLHSLYSEETLVEIKEYLGL